MTKTFCDRCGNHMTHTAVGCWGKVSVTLNSAAYADLPTNMDMCAFCVEQLKNFFKRVSQVTPHENPQRS